MSTTHEEWMDAFFASYYSHRPVNSTCVGLCEHDHTLPDLSEAGVGDALSDARDLLSASPGGEVGGAREIDQRLARGYLRIQEWEFGSEHFQGGNPSFHTGEAIFGIISLFLTESGPLSERVAAATARMSAIPTFLDQARQCVQESPRSWTERAIRECDGAHALFTDGVEQLAHTMKGASGPVPASAVSLFSAAAEDAVRAFAEHRIWLESDLSHKTHERYACGAEAFDLYMKEGHCLDESAEEVLLYAEDQLAQAETYGAQHCSDFAASNASEVTGRLGDIAPSASEYYDRYGEIWSDVRALSDEKGLVTWPDFPIRYVPRPEWVRSASPHLYFLFYRSPAAFHRPETHEYLVAPLPEEQQANFLRANNDSVIRRNHVIHHGGIGHHIQNWHAFRAESRIGQMAAVDCASRIAMFCGGTMAEGWACYATDLASEAGALSPVEQFAEAVGRGRMAARAIVDIRLHRGEFTLDEAASFYEDRAGMPAAAARGEAIKNSMFPGAALIYLTGTDAIHRLRSEVASRSQGGFDLRAFHDRFLSYGSVPVSLIAKDMLKGDNDAE
ncbi:MAG: DUF885 family protein [Longimicrobiales bacterium]